MNACLAMLAAPLLFAPRTQDAAPIVPELKPLAFFVGEWTGQGSFSNGKSIEADASFKPDLEGHAISYRHDDKAPNRYHALTMWSYDAAKKGLVSRVFDNFGGFREFTCPGWEGDKLIWQNEAEVKGAKVLSRFVFDRMDPASFRMTYEVQRDSEWRMVDSLVFKRK